jgi:hypothetical protein
MAYDQTEITALNAPWRWVRQIKWLKGDSAPLDPAPTNAAAQLAALDPSYRSVLEYVEGIDIGDVHGATIPTVAIKSVGATSVVFSITDQDVDCDGVFYGLNTQNYDGSTTPSAPGSWSNDTGLTSYVNKTFTASGLTPGKHLAFSFKGKQGAATYSTATAVLYAILAPAAVADLAAVDGTGHANVSWTPSAGIASQTLYYKTGLTATVSSIVSTGTAVTLLKTDTTKAVTLAAGDYSFAIVSTNPSGSVNNTAAARVTLV